MSFFANVNIICNFGLFFLLFCVPSLSIFDIVKPACGQLTLRSDESETTEGFDSRVFSMKEASLPSPEQFLHQIIEGAEIQSWINMYQNLIENKIFSKHKS